MIKTAVFCDFLLPKPRNFSPCVAMMKITETLAVLGFGEVCVKYSFLTYIPSPVSHKNMKNQLKVLVGLALV